MQIIRSAFKFLNSISRISSALSQGHFKLRILIWGDFFLILIIYFFLSPAPGSEVLVWILPWREFAPAIAIAEKIIVIKQAANIIGRSSVRCLLWEPCKIIFWDRAKTKPVCRSGLTRTSLWTYPLWVGNRLSEPPSDQSNSRKIARRVTVYPPGCQRLSGSVPSLKIRAIYPKGDGLPSGSVLSLKNRNC